MVDSLYTYCTDILTGEIPSGLHTKNAVKRFNKDLALAKDSLNGWYFDEDAVQKVIDFIAQLKHFAGKYNDKNFILQPWQVFIVANLYGFINRDGTRRFQTAYLEMARKQGKTALVAALALYHLIGDDEAAAEILFAANSKEQATIGFLMVKGFAKLYHNKKYKDNAYQQRVRRYRTDILFPESNSFIKTLAADADKLDGYNCNFGVVDEYHSAQNSQIRDVIRSSQGMRDNPLLITITTAGFDKSLPCYELRTVCTEIIAGVKEDDSLFSIIYSLDEDDDWADSAVWIKSNPNIDITVNSAFIKRQVQQAMNSPADEVGVKTKNLNIWCDSAHTWIPDNYVVNSIKKLNKDDFKGEQCFIGVDLASNVDLTAVSYLFVKNSKYYFFVDYYIPADSLKAGNLHADKELYKKWVATKYLNTTSGNVTDYDSITKEILAVDDMCDIEDIYYDKYNATQWAIQCTEENLNMTPFGQSIGNFNNCTKEFERLILSGHVVIDDNPITRYCLRNVELKMDFNANVKPVKLNEKSKIDGVIASLQALAAYLEYTSNLKSIEIY
jgi:phage terminase large subunit-like protein